MTQLYRQFVQSGAIQQSVALSNQKHPFGTWVIPTTRAQTFGASQTTVPLNLQTSQKPEPSS